MIDAETLEAKALRKVSARAQRDAKAYAAPLVTPPKVHDACDLLRTEIRPARSIVPGWIYEGLGLLVSAPKFGKSTLMLQIIVAVANGGEFWGVKVPKARVLMIDLETNERRLRRKLDQAGATSLEPGMLCYATSWPRGAAGVAAMADYVDQHDVRLVVIDTWQRFRECESGKKNAYAADYDSLAQVQELCKTRPGLGIIAIHHRRKAASDDPIDSINGSAGIAASADAIWILARKGGDYFLHIEARDWDRDENEFRIERDSGQWVLSDAPRYSQNEIEVLKLLDVAKGMTPSALGEGLGISKQAAHARLNRMRESGLVKCHEGTWHVS